MSAGRWRVYFLHLSRKWVVRDQNDEFSGGFRTLPEAHTHAMKLARTVEVELPRVGKSREITTYGYKTIISRNVDGYLWLESEGEVFCILRDEAEDFAKTILALRYDYERNQK